jgi:hypothetical protein
VKFINLPLTPPSPPSAGCAAHIRFEANISEYEAKKMVLFACFASKKISKFSMSNEFGPEANFRFKRIFEAKCSEYFVKETEY